MDPKGQPDWKQQTQPTLTSTTPTSQRTGLCLTPVASLRWPRHDFDQTASTSLILSSTCFPKVTVEVLSDHGDESDDHSGGAGDSDNNDSHQ